MVLSESKTQSKSKTQATAPPPLYDAIYDLVKQIPEGQVATYGQIAEMLGLYGRARQVGYALFQVAPGSDIPWHRVVNAQGKISRSPMRQGNDDLQRILLEREGIVFDTQEKLNLSRYRWNPAVSAQQ
jgi:methylated-DNA-protein-cysteine methyltransferase related protein